MALKPKKVVSVSNSASGLPEAWTLSAFVSCGPNMTGCMVRVTTAVLFFACLVS